MDTLLIATLLGTWYLQGVHRLKLETCAGFSSVATLVQSPSVSLPVIGRTKVKLVALKLLFTVDTFSRAHHTVALKKADALFLPEHCRVDACEPTRLKCDRAARSLRSRVLTCIPRAPYGFRRRINKTEPVFANAIWPRFVYRSVSLNWRCQPTRNFQPIHFDAETITTLWSSIAHIPTWQ